MVDGGRVGLAMVGYVKAKRMRRLGVLWPQDLHERRVRDERRQQQTEDELDIRLGQDVLL